MAVASFQLEGEAPVVRGFFPPKTATVQHWYRAAVQGIEDAPNWKEIPNALNTAVIEEDLITIEGSNWMLFIARKKNL